MIEICDCRQSPGDSSVISASVAGRRDDGILGDALTSDRQEALL